jgi:uncharacterized protein
MEKKPIEFNESQTLEKLKHYLPAQAPLKDFIHHNTLHAFQHENFEKALNEASTLFGYRVSLSLHEYRQLFKAGKISEKILDRVLHENKGEKAQEWKIKVMNSPLSSQQQVRIGELRKNWKTVYNYDLELDVQPLLFRLLCSFLDQGVSIWNYPVPHKSFLDSVRELQKNSFSGLFSSKRCMQWLLDKNTSIEQLLHILVGDASLFEQYLFDQQFSHQGWSGMASVLEKQPESLLDKRKIHLKELVIIELLLEIEALDKKFNQNWAPLATRLNAYPKPLFSKVDMNEFMELHLLWQNAFEWTYYDEVLAGLHEESKKPIEKKETSFQAMFCIDDRECSLRRYVEQFDPNCETFGTPGFFGVEFYYQPEHGKFYTKLCPAPMYPNHLIKEVERRSKRKQEAHFTKHSHNLFTGWLITQTLGFWSAFKLFLNVFRPSISPASTSSFRHMDKYANLTYQNYNPEFRQDGMQIGFTVDEMATRVENLLRGIGLIQNFAKIIYVVGHGASSANNTHYAGYDCGACSGRPGSVNARVFSYMANHPKVRLKLEEKGISIPKDTHFFGALHDTTRDEIEFFDEASLPWLSIDEHLKHHFIFKKALAHNARERARRFDSVNPKWSLRRINNKVQLRSVSLFEPRPELNHATNSLCIVGRRSLTKHLFLDRRAFLNSHNYRLDPDGKHLLNILKAVAPVCGGINLEYYFSRVDNQKLGAGSKLPHNVMGLIGVANGIDGDLRTGLPLQMIELHDPIRLLVVVEHYPDVLLDVIKRDSVAYEWFKNTWIHLAVIHPDSGDILVFKNETFVLYQPIAKNLPKGGELKDLLVSSRENLHVHHLN